ncbi:hypothetical protein KA005_78915 [bacterium]|nr:hypothetical protein [bacterium]
MAGNAYKSTTNLWVVDSTGTLNEGGVTIVKIIYIPSAVNDDLILDDNADNTAIVLKAGASDVSPIHVDFGEKGRALPSLKVNTIDGGTAYIYFRIP